jgi:hypothetical protein
VTFKTAKLIFFCDLGQPLEVIPLDDAGAVHVPRFAACAHTGRGKLEVIETHDKLDVLRQRYGELAVIRGWLPG